MKFVYFIIIMFLIIFLLVISYVIYAKIMQIIDVKRTTRFEHEIRPIVEKHLKITNELDIPISEISELRTKVRTKPGLQAFNKIYFEKLEKNKLDEQLRQYVRSIIDYHTLYKNRIVRDKYRKSYILYLLAEYYMDTDEVIKFALSNLDNSSQYVRNNALRVLRNTGNVEAFIAAYQKISNGELYFNNKVIVDFIDSFQGDMPKLNSTLASSIDEFSPQIQKVIIDHFANRKISDFSCEILRIIKQSKDKEIVISGIKYFGMIRYQEAYNFIVEQFEGDKYEIRAICARAIALYNCEKTIKLLEENITDSNWFVRYNCAFTLIHLEEGNVFSPNSRIGKIIRGNDRFAKEMIIYTLYSTHLINKDNYKDKLASFQPEIEIGEEEEINDIGALHPVY